MWGHYSLIPSSVSEFVENLPCGNHAGLKGVHDFRPVFTSFMV